MSKGTDMNEPHVGQERWLKMYYLIRAVFSFAWVAAAVGAGRHAPALAAALLVAYPAWDALANLIDGARSGGLAANRTQAVNVAASLIVAVGVAIALPDQNRVLAVFGAWAIVSGLLQLGTGLRRWKSYGAQWAMILSGAQSALAGAAFIVQARTSAAPAIATAAGYAGFGAFYFLMSALSLQAAAWRRKRAAGT
jgi:hypothetical protein